MPHQCSRELATVGNDCLYGSPEFTWQEIAIGMFNLWYMRNNSLTKIKSEDISMDAGNVLHWFFIVGSALALANKSYISNIYPKFCISATLGKQD